ncbi:MAG: N-acetylglucosamine-6-phosphate deacetylase [Victivallaceae bacterium]|nr:N-acetylglucosamine-6-phosphate deacetylase [Victivallaceae bacterium]
MKKTLLTNCHIISPEFEAFDAAVMIEGDTIRRIYVDAEQLPAADEVIDIGGDMLMPGFIDVHCHGRSGSDFSDASLEGLTRICVDKLSEGVTSLLPTTLTLPESQLAASLKTAAEYVAAGSKGCRVPGVHLEGPYINPKCCGAQNPDFVRKPDIEEVRRLNRIFKVLKVSYAIETEGGPKFAEELLAEGITPSCVHSAANYSQFLEGNAHGLRSMSHFCNQMSPLHHRDIGLVGAGFLCEDVYIELICDKLHVCPDMINFIFSFKNVERIQLISDAMRAAGMPNGEYDLGGLNVVVAEGAARLKSNGALAGSTLQICDALRNVWEVTGIELTELVKCTSYNQAKLMGLEKTGRVAPGYLADFAVLDGDFKVTKTFVGGVRKF